MRIITGNRGSGKTVELVKEANTLAAQGHKVIMITSHKVFEEIFKNYGLSDKVQVVTFKEYQRNSIGNDSYKNADILIDEIDIFLKAILNNNVASITANKEDMFEVKREDWSKDGK